MRPHLQISFFNIQAAHHEWQDTMEEKLSFKPDSLATFGLGHIGQNRLLRLSDIVNSFSIRYQCTVNVNYPSPKGDEPEVKITNLPLDLIPYI